MPEFKSRSYANPRRLPRRNHYQEGPGFLFVATQGGRPPESIVGAGPAAIVRRRRAALRRWADGEPLATIGGELHCSRASLFRWRTRSLGMTSEQQRKEVMALRDLLATMHDTQIGLGLVPGALPNTVSLTQNTLSINAVDDYHNDPLSGFLADFPSAIPVVMDGLDQAMAQAMKVVEGQTQGVTSADDATSRR